MYIGIKYQGLFLWLCNLSRLNSFMNTSFLHFEIAGGGYCVFSVGYGQKIDSLNQVSVA